MRPRNIYHVLIYARFVLVNLPLFISREPLWVLLERHHAECLLWTFQISFGECRRKIFCNNLFRCIHSFWSNWNFKKSSKTIYGKKTHEFSERKFARDACSSWNTPFLQQKNKSQAVIAEAVLSNVLYFFRQYKTQKTRGCYFMQTVFVGSLFPQAWFSKTHLQCKETCWCHKNQSENISNPH